MPTGFDVCRRQSRGVATHQLSIKECMQLLISQMVMLVIHCFLLPFITIRPAESLHPELTHSWRSHQWTQASSVQGASSAKSCSPHPLCLVPWLGERRLHWLAGPPA